MGRGWSRKLAALAMAAALVGSVSTSASKEGDGDAPRGRSGKGSDGPGFDGQIDVPGPFARGSAFLLLGDDDCRFLYPRWVGMAQDTRDVNERASGVETPGFPIACARSGQSVTCKVFVDGFTAAFSASVKAETASELRFGTAGGYIEAVVDLQKRTASFKQTAPSGRSTVCETKYKSREDAAEDVAKLDPAPPNPPRPAKARPNGMASDGDRLKWKSRHETLAPKDPLTGRRIPSCSACTNECGFVGEECKGGVCVYTGKGDDRGSESSSSSGPSTAVGGKKKRGKRLGQSCKTTSECEEGRVCSQRTPRLRTCQ